MMGRPTSKPIFIYSEAVLNYFFHDEHPFNQKRIALTKQLLECCGFLTPDQVRAPRLATDEELLLVHDREYIEAVKKASQVSGQSSPGQEHPEFHPFGLGTEDTPLFPDMHRQAVLAVGGTLLGAELIAQGRTKRVLNLAGGLHHAQRGKASGFCIYNDCAVAIEYVRKQYDMKVLYIDTDAHHGDGVQWIFYHDPHVFTFSIHETGRYLYPGTGHVNEKGIGEGYGYCLNLPVDAFTQDASWLDCFERGLEAVLQFFKPDIIISQHGCDAHFYDPLTHLAGSMSIYARMPELIKQAAETYTGGKWLAVGGGGYDIYRVVPRAWGLLWMVMNDVPVKQGPLPESWLSAVRAHVNGPVPALWLDEEEVLPVIPRQKEIEEKNRLMLKQALSYLRQQVGPH
nr:acetoin utilization protein AcuC [Caldalkalibacillus thermarum]